MAAKYQRLADLLTRDIQAGAFQPGERLPGEIDLARRFDVSRGTIRQALSSLQDAGLIETWTGAGSFVCYNGARLEDELGWSRALARHGVALEPRILRFERLDDSALAETLALPSPAFLALDRVRSTDDGKPISLELSRLPWREDYAAVLEHGLVEGSLRRTLEMLEIRAVGGTEAADLVRLSASEAMELQQTEGEPFLGTTRIVHDASGAIIEHVRSRLHPSHFTLQLSFGESQK
ncbi:GntR family transcriptional regulator [Acidisoma cellulosilytica]|uniref:GntR family transcriptional regulator n=1 Tax=Acidisoma cellulosilyticum TaxID=2802395 RepID=A0A964E5I8_9PROT|nr:GntR family transcriptional regulator [Acidisoma cellulosilyticum]MCB8882033.1 GntR family transcriptional regulator [Acidisoma cellulosilyticum]